MVARVKAQFRARIERNGWLSPETRAQALAKLDKTEIRVGYPSKWIDYTGVVVRRDDYAGNAMRLNEFLVRRELAKFGKPVELDQFAVPTAHAADRHQRRVRPELERHRDSRRVPAAAVLRRQGGPGRQLSARWGR